MTGGNWTATNKVRPGVYVNFNSAPQPLGAVGERGIVTMPVTLSWGEAGRIVTIEAGENTTEKLGYPVSAPELLLVREALKRAKTLLLYRVNEGVKASATLGELIATARYGGERGNDITVVVEANADSPALFDVSTLVAGVEKDRQTVAHIAGLKANAWVEWNASGGLTESAGIPLTGGSNDNAVNQSYIDYLDAIETQQFHAMALPSTDAELKALFVSFINNLRDNEGRKVVLAVENYPAANYEGIISVKNGVVLADGRTVNAAQATAWVAGASAAAGANESLTYAGYDGAVDASPRFTHTQIVAALQTGEFLFSQDGARAFVEQDINTFTAFTPDKGRYFSKNRVIRVLDAINNDISRVFSSYYIGKVANNADGRTLLKNEIVNYMTNLQNIGAIQNLDSDADITVAPIEGQSDGVLVGLYIQPVDAVEKIYISVEVK
ncbi:phage tail sheath protein [Paenibacillus sp. 1011MAR3C5]|uniref:phage tail sheath family protein n=1 Tax=Paenibacillus sp. 1011MAR3C5 TaxID=1675787 RepID=UPI000E6D20B8|nr:phage tail sheath family protein [Paenibacillus sp. 1011MAR3C5]RJE84277.1 phage tail sheath protein [Paenibacillus sp. 1011MAR3C5]